MKIAVLKERWPNETRVAASPETVKKLIGLGAEVGLGNGAYLKSEYRYSNYEDGLGKNDILTGIGVRF